MSFVQGLAVLITFDIIRHLIFSKLILHRYDDFKSASEGFVLPSLRHER